MDVEINAKDLGILPISNEGWGARPFLVSLYQDSRRQASSAPRWRARAHDLRPLHPPNAASKLCSLCFLHHCGPYYVAALSPRPPRRRTPSLSFPSYHGERVQLSSSPTPRIREANSCSWAPIIGLVVVAVFCGSAWFLSPKGENQTIWRSTLVLSAAAMYIMWGKPSSSAFEGPKLISFVQQ